ncbi:MAG: ATP-binding cassette domain-containing protein [Chloroflexi bacterium]|nr:ATP-binding cassette domain-containing protein [Chloroflexota bacterium]
MIEVENLTKYYGDFLAIENISFKVNKGEVVGLLGPNGSGKTTTMRILTGFMPPSSGTARVAGHDIVDQGLEARRMIGYMPESVPLYTDMTVSDYLAFMGALRGMDKKRIARRIDAVIDLCRLGDYRHDFIGKLSKGYRQRVGIAQCVLHEPAVLILDEPTIGIDPIQVVETRQLIKNLRGEQTVLVSTHILPEVSMICQRVVIIHEGQVVAEDTPENLSERLQGNERLEIEIRGPAADVMSAIRGLKGVTDVRRDGGGDRAQYTIYSRRGADLREQLAALVVSRGWGLLKLNPMSMTLEEIFLRLTSEEEKA